jgi:hypothetical protein
VIQRRVVNANGAPVRSYQPDDDVKASGLAGTVRAKESNNLATLYVQGYVFDDGASLVPLAEVLGM